MKRLAAVLLLLAGSASADVLVLKDGRKLSGRVSEKPDGFEITVESTPLAFAKDEVERWIKSPKEIVGDADTLVADAKKIYSEAVELKDEKAAEAKFKEALPKVMKARDAYAEARDLFPEGHSDLDTALVQVMKLMRLVRERIGSQIASAPAGVKPKDAPPPTPEPKPEPKVEPKAEPVSPKVTTFADAVAVLVDPARRAAPEDSAAAREIFRKAWDGKGAESDVAAAGYLFLSRKLAVDPALDAFFKAASLVDVPERETLDALKALAGKLKELRGKGGDASAEPVLLLAGAVMSVLLDRSRGKPGPDLEAAVKEFGFEKSEYGAIWGRKDALAMDDYRKWVGTGDYGLAIVQFQNDYRGLTDVGSRYALGLLMMLKALADNRLYGRAASQFETLSRSVSSAPQRDHIAALAKSIREASPCTLCGGTHQVNCTACKGKKKVTLECNKCGGSGKLNTFNGVKACSACQGKGRYVNVDCPKCKASGKTECKVRTCKEVERPGFASFAEAYRCAECQGRGGLFRSVAHPCSRCLGVGLLLAPKSDPSRMMIK